MFGPIETEEHFYNFMCFLADIGCITEEELTMVINFYNKQVGKSNENN